MWYYTLQLLAIARITRARNHYIYLQVANTSTHFNDHTKHQLAIKSFNVTYSHLAARSNQFPSQSNPYSNVFMYSPLLVNQYRPNQTLLEAHKSFMVHLASFLVNLMSFLVLLAVISQTRQVGTGDKVGLS
jgi:hypothetical protein